MSDFTPRTFVSPGNTRPNTPVNLNRDEGHNYHIIYRCDVHGQQNHYGPYCTCVPSEISVHMPPQLPDGTFPPILANGSIPWPPQVAPPIDSPSGGCERNLD